MKTDSLVGVDIGGTKVNAGRIESNRLVRSTSAPVTTQGRQKEILDEVMAVIAEVFDPDVVGIGVGVPSVVDVDRGIVYDVQNIPSWDRVPLKEILEDRFQRPVYVNNDANCFAVGEKHFGLGVPYRNLVGVTLGTGLGAGIIIDHRLYSGLGCGAGEFGSISYRDHIVEYYCSGQFFSNVHGLKGHEVHERAGRGDKTSLGIFEEFGTHLGEAVKTIMFAVDPEAIILGGSVIASYPFFERSLRERIRTFPYRISAERIQIKISEEKNIALLGAAALYYDALLGPALKPDAGAREES